MEEEKFQQAELTNKLLLDLIRNQKNNASNMFRVFIITICCYTVILIAMIIGFFAYELQFETTDEITQRVEQEVSGDGSSINNVEGDQYTGNATHNTY